MTHYFEMAFGITFGIGAAVLALILIASFMGMFDK